jgi:hypothetical protein
VKSKNQTDDPMHRAQESRLTRRAVLLGGAGLLGSTLLMPRFGSAAQPSKNDAALAKALGESKLVYISPLHANKSESRCHGEVWFFVDAGDVVIVTAKDRWKARALETGRDRARLWVGEHGRGRFAGDGYRQAPSFVAKARLDTDDATFARLLTAFSTRYPEEWAKWKPRFEQGRADGSRVIIRYARHAE